MTLSETATPNIYNIRMMPQMLREWFKLKSANDRIETLRLLGGQVFLPTLTSIYRAEKYLYEVGDEMLSFQLPQSSKTARRKIVTKLLRGAFTHAHGFLLKDLKPLGLRVGRSESEVSDLTSRIYSIAEDCMLNRSSDPAAVVKSALFSTGFDAWYSGWGKAFAVGKIGASTAPRQRNGWEVNSGGEASKPPLTTSGKRTSR